MKKLLVPSFALQALTICGLGLPLVGVLMATVMLSLPVGPCDTFMGYTLLVFSALLFFMSVRYCLAAQQLGEPDKAQLQAEAELQEDIECYNNMMTPLERQLLHRITYQRAQQRIGFGAATSYEDEEDFDIAGERIANYERASEAIGN